MRQERPMKRMSTSHQPQVNLHVLGAAGDVTGSLNLFEVIHRDSVTRFILDVGLHQENDNINRSHRLPKGLTAKDIDFVIISHAHIDHSGYLPKLIKDGFRGFAYTHAATKDLLRILLPDSGRLQEAAAERENHANQKQDGKRAKRVRPLYNADEAYASLDRIKAWHYDRSYQLGPEIAVKFTQASHILGAAVVTITVGRGKSAKKICFTGNIGRNDMPILCNLAPVREADYIISESTYGNKLHVKRDRLEVLAGIINRAYERAKKNNGVIVIPAFAVSRVQTVLYDLRALIAAKRIPEMPVFVDSPMAIAATKVHRRHKKLYNAEARALVAQGQDPFSTPRYLECLKWKQSRLLDKPVSEPVIMIGSSGMAAGGRILSHIEKRLPHAENTIVFVGFQGSGMLGSTLVNEKPKEVMIHHNLVPVNATIEFMSDYSGHADYSEIIAWFKLFTKKPKNVFLVHGETEALSQFKQHIQSALGWNVTIPTPRQSFRLA